MNEASNGGTVCSCLDQCYATTRQVTIDGTAPVDVGSPSQAQSRRSGGLRTKGYCKRSQPGKPLITVITAVFNGVRDIETTIQSVINQTYDNVEYIIIDGDSRDGTADIIANYEGQIDYWLSEPDHGICDAWNKAINLATGDYLSFLNAADEYMPEALATVSVRLPGYDFSWGDMLWLTERGDSTFFKGRDSYAEVVDYVMPFNHPTMFFRRSSIVAVQGYDAKYRYAMDYDLVRKMLAKSCKGVHISATIARMQAGGVHDRNYSKTVREVRDIAVHHGTSFALASLAQCYTLLRRSANQTPVGWLLSRMARWIKRATKSI